MRLLLVDVEGLGLDFALRCADAGHDVRWFRADAHKSRDGEGFKGITRVSDWRKHMAWAREGVILNTGNCKYLAELDRYRELGFPIFGPSYKSAQLEIRRDLGMSVLKKAGIDLPPYKMFSSLQEASAHARKSSDAFVFKTMGDECDKSLTYVSKDPADMVGWIEQKIKRGMILRGPCMLQEKIDMLCELGVSGWMGKEGFLEDKWQVCIEHKKLMNDEKGTTTGETGTATVYAKTELLAEECLVPLEKVFRSLGHRGDTAVGVGIDKKGKAWPFEFTLRNGYPAWFLQIASHKGDPLQWMKDLLVGKDTLKVSYDACIGVVAHQPPFPSEKFKPDEVEGNPISGLDDVWDDIHPCQVMIGKGPVMDKGKVVDAPMYQTSGPYVLVATGLGSNVADAKQNAYSSLDKISFPNIGFRTDIGNKVIKALPGLHKHGYALGMKA